VTRTNKQKGPVVNLVMQVHQLLMQEAQLSQQQQHQ